MFLDASIAALYEVLHISAELDNACTLHTKIVCCLQVGRRGPLSAGVQFNPEASPKNGGSPQDLSQLLESAHNCASYSISYTPASTAAGRQQPCHPVLDMAPCLGVF